MVFSEGQVQVQDALNTDEAQPSQVRPLWQKHLQLWLVQPRRQQELHRGTASIQLPHQNRAANRPTAFRRAGNDDGHALGGIRLRQDELRL